MWSDSFLPPKWSRPPFTSYAHTSASETHNLSHCGVLKSHRLRPQDTSHLSQASFSLEVPILNPQVWLAASALGLLKLLFCSIVFTTLSVSLSELYPGLWSSWRQNILVISSCSLYLTHGLVFGRHPVNILYWLWVLEGNLAEQRGQYMKEVKYFLRLCVYMWLRKEASSRKSILSLNWKDHDKNVIKNTPW